ncbi:MAG: RIP metalloprotease RseP [Parcubacteria group bacterium]|nr:RIP metalloprotease RseP [Parcubacteria group bacterium]
MTFILFILVLGILVIVHEFGHFIFARYFGVKVDEFGFGFPPRLFGVKKGQTLFSLNLFPLGGFVKIFGEEGEGKGDPSSFVSNSALRRALIISAGVIMNLILAWFLFSLIHFLGIPQAVEKDDLKAKNIKIQILAIQKDSPAEKSGLKIGDAILMLEQKNDVFKISENIPTEDVIKFIKERAGRELVLQILRGKEVIMIKAVPRENPPPREGALGIAIERVGIAASPWYLAPIDGLKTTFNTAALFLYSIFNIVKNLIIGQHQELGITGPIGIAVLTRDIYRLGFIYFLQFIALISINLAVINIFPFPALDGGRLLFIAIEKIKGSPVSQSAEKITHAIGFALLIFLMIFVTFRDIQRFF